MAQYDISPDSLRRASKGVGDAADELDSALTSFAQALSSVGDPWGTDTLGTLIGGGYAATEELALQTYNSVVESLDGFSEGLEDMAMNYGDAEDRTTTEVDSTGRQV